MGLINYYLENGKKPVSFCLVLGTKKERIKLLKPYYRLNQTTPTYQTSRFELGAFIDEKSNFDHKVISI
jgi:hypothetical protein